MTATLSAQTIASEQKRLNGKAFSFTQIRTPKPPPSPAPSAKTTVARTIDRKTGILSGRQEIRIHQLLGVAFTLHIEGANPLLCAIEEVMQTRGLDKVEEIGRFEYELVERRLECFILMRGGEVPRVDW